jgi:hypothetical protein
VLLGVYTPAAPEERPSLTSLVPLQDRLLLG